jgi:hypothetical protein
MKRFLISIMGIFVLLGVNHASARTSCHSFRRHVCLAQASRHYANHVHIWRLARLGPQSCFLMPDVAVAVGARGPYCSSPRGYYGLRPLCR